MSTIDIRPLWHKGKNQVGIYFKYNDALASKLRSIDCEFSYTHHCWYIENTEFNKRNLLFILQQYDYSITDHDKNELKLKVNLRSDLSAQIIHELNEFRKHLQVSRYGQRTIEVY